METTTFASEEPLQHGRNNVPTIFSRRGRHPVPRLSPNSFRDNMEIKDEDIGSGGSGVFMSPMPQFSPSPVPLSSFASTSSFVYPSPRTFQFLASPVRKQEDQFLFDSPAMKHTQTGFGTSSNATNGSLSTSASTPLQPPQVPRANKSEFPLVQDLRQATGQAVLLPPSRRVNKPMSIPRPPTPTPESNANANSLSAADDDDAGNSQSNGKTKRKRKHVKPIAEEELQARKARTQARKQRKYDREKKKRDIMSVQFDDLLARLNAEPNSDRSQLLQQLLEKLKSGRELNIV